MSAMSHDEMIAVIQAHKEGSEIEYRYLGPNSHLREWLSMESPQFFNFSDCRYRVKPEPLKPREWWIQNGCKVAGSFQRLLDSQPIEPCPDCEFIHVREVID